MRHGQSMGKTKDPKRGEFSFIVIKYYVAAVWLYNAPKPAYNHVYYLLSVIISWSQVTAVSL